VNAERAETQLASERRCLLREGGEVQAREDLSRGTDGEKRFAERILTRATGTPPLPELPATHLAQVAPQSLCERAGDYQYEHGTSRFRSPISMRSIKPLWSIQLLQSSGTTQFRHGGDTGGLPEGWTRPRPSARRMRPALPFRSPNAIFSLFQSCAPRVEHHGMRIEGFCARHVFQTASKLSARSESSFLLLRKHQ
jgi:hypothetical protein